MSWRCVDAEAGEALCADASSTIRQPRLDFTRSVPRVIPSEASLEAEPSTGPPLRRAGGIITSVALTPTAEMKSAHSAGIVLHRSRGDVREVLLVHPGGPFWARRDLGAWSIPKGEYEPGEDALDAARREFEEELGSSPPDGPTTALGEIRQKSGKLVRAWALAGDLDPTAITSNTFELEWPPRSGRSLQVPEVDRAEWFTLEQARARINPAQVPLLERLEALGR